MHMLIGWRDKLLKDVSGKSHCEHTETWTVENIVKNLIFSLIYSPAQFLSFLPLPFFLSVKHGS